MKKIKLNDLTNILKERGYDIAFAVFGIILLIILIVLFVFSVSFSAESIDKALRIDESRNNLVRFNVDGFMGLGIVPSSDKNNSSSSDSIMD